MSNTQSARRPRAKQTTGVDLADLNTQRQKPLPKQPQVFRSSSFGEDLVEPQRRTAPKRTAPTMGIHKKMNEELAAMQRSSPMAEATARVHQAQYHAGPMISSYRVAASPGFGGFPQVRPNWVFVVMSLAMALLCWYWLATPAKTNISMWSGDTMQTLTGEAPAQPAEEARLPQLATPPGQHSLVLAGAPSVTAAQVDSVLSKFGSPAAGTGELWVKLGEQYQIDPAYALAFFIHESSAGTNPNWAGLKPGGATTHNVGNIICAGYATCYGRFRDYPDWQTGIADWYRLIRDEYVQGRNAHTLEQIIPIYAPSVENNVPAYVQAVTNLINSWKQ